MDSYGDTYNIMVYLVMVTQTMTTDRMTMIIIITTLTLTYSSGPLCRACTGKGIRQVLTHTTILTRIYLTVVKIYKKTM